MTITVHTTDGHRQRLWLTDGTPVGGDTTTPVEPPPTPVTYPDLPDLIPGGERTHPYTMPTTAPWTVPTRTIIPTPEGSGDVVHPSVVDMVAETGQPFRGFRYWMAVTPYADDNAELEDPHIVVSNHGWEWQNPEGITNPIDDAQTGAQPGSYNSDPCLIWDGHLHRFVLLWRRFGVGIHGATSADGITWTIQWGVHPGGGLGDKSPSLIRRASNNWIMMCGEGLGHSELALYTGPEALGPFTRVGPLVWEGLGDTGGADHHSARWDEDTGHFFMLAMSKSRQGIFPAVSPDGLHWTAGAPFLAQNLTYHATMTPDPDDPAWCQVWYSHNGPWSVRHTRVPRTLWTDLIT